MGSEATTVCLRYPPPVTSASTETLARLRAVLAGGPPMRLAVLFGSQATGRANPDSDFDIGIVPIDPDLPLRDELTLANALSEVVGAEVDLVRLDTDQPLLGREIARSGVCLVECEPGGFAAYRATAVSRWLDFDETVAPHRERFLRRLAGAST